MNRTQKAGLCIGGLAIVASAACGKRSSPVDGDLARDLATVKGTAPGLELAPHGGNSQVVVSAIEGGPESAPKRAAVQPARSPTQHASAPRVVGQPVAPRNAPAPHADVAEVPAPAPRQARSSERAPDPAPLPPAPGTGRERQQGASATEAEIFRRMPWIRP